MKRKNIHTRTQANLKKQRMYYRNLVTPCQTPNHHFSAVRSLRCNSLIFWFPHEAKLWVERDLLQETVLLKCDFLLLRGRWGFSQKATHVIPSDPATFVLSQELECPKIGQGVMDDVLCFLAMVSAQ